MDIHNHVLFGLDDGSKTIEDSIALAKAFQEENFINLLATPHYIQDGPYKPTVEQVLQTVEKLNEVLREKEIPVSVYPGMEVRLTRTTCEDFRAGKLLTLNNSRYLLAELPDTNVRNFLDTLLYEIQGEGVTPIIAHAERHIRFMQDVRIAKEYIDRGIFIQVNKGSIEGEFGPDAQRTAQKLLKNGWVHFIATDAHRIKHRNPKMRSVEKKLFKMIGQENLALLTVQNPNAVLTNQPIESMTPIKRKKYKVLTVCASIALVLFIGGTLLVQTFNRKFDQMMHATFTPELIQELDEILLREGLIEDIEILHQGSGNQMSKDQLLGTNVNTNSAEELTNIEEVQPNEIKTGTSSQVNKDDNHTANMSLPRGTKDNSSNLKRAKTDSESLTGAKDTPNKGTKTQIGSLAKQSLATGNTNTKGTSQNKNANTATKEAQENASQTQEVETFTTADRARVVKIITDAVPKQKIQDMENRVNRGLTQEDVTEGKRILKTYLPAEKIKELRDLYVKFSNAQG